MKKERAAGRLLIYGCGRRVEAGSEEVGRVIGSWATRGEGFRDLVEEALASEIFRSK